MRIDWITVNVKPLLPLHKRGRSIRAVIIPAINSHQSRQSNDEYNDFP